MNMLQIFTVGDTLYGYCNGYFGRDDYDIKVCVVVRPKYAVFENNEGYATVLNMPDCGRINRATVEGWMVDDD